MDREARSRGHRKQDADFSHHRQQTLRLVGCGRASWKRRQVEISVGSHALQKILVSYFLFFAPSRSRSRLLWPYHILNIRYSFYDCRLLYPYNNHFLALSAKDLTLHYAPKNGIVLDVYSAWAVFGKDPAQTAAAVTRDARLVSNQWNAKFSSAQVSSQMNPARCIVLLI